ncbi:SPOR domain-containing protein [Maribacter halichondriae]|uniref:HU domain-containing protein n=1 Tax=Maribacter halichondriae TaxID=2980554 RepID=UPI00235A258E|nr:SPOR domain-containing protein [Maribacter sp. Hal144]
MALEHYIAELLYRYNCVVVPDFGAFLTQTKSAVIDTNANTFYPPSKSLSFNAQLTSNDGLLVSYMAEAEKVSYEEMLAKLNDFVKTWKGQLIQGEHLTLANIGKLFLNSDAKIVFQPSDKVNYLTSSFGLPSFVSAPVMREVLKEEVLAMEERIPFIITPEQKEHSEFTLRPYLKYAAIFLLAVSTGLTGLRFYNETVNAQQLAQEEAQQKVSEHIQEATFFDAKPIELPTVNLDVITKKKHVATHHIVAGAFRFRKNADKKIGQLKRRGFEAEYLGTNDHGLHVVTYSRYTDAQKALRELRKIKITQSKDAWLLSKK